MKRADIDTFEKLSAQLDSLHQEMSMLTKKSPNDAVNAFKIKFVNATLIQCNKFLGKKYRPFQDFEIFSMDELPSNSDVTFIVSQYIKCTEEYRSDNIEQSRGLWYWRTDGSLSEVRTASPKKLSQK
jgi:hypothetical protein